MGAGEYLSDESVHQYDKMKRNTDNPIISGILMLVAYMLAGFIPLLPIILFDYPYSVYFTLAFGLLGLFAWFYKR